MKEFKFQTLTTDPICDKAGGLRAGFGRADIMPKSPCFLCGYPHVERTSTGTHDPLLASAICLKSAECTLIFISVDLLFVSLTTGILMVAARLMTPDGAWRFLLRW